MGLMDLEELMSIMALTLLTKSASLDFRQSSRDFGASSCDNSLLSSLTLLQLLMSMLDGSHVDTEGVGDISIVHFTIVVNQGHDHGTSHFRFSE